MIIITLHQDETQPSIMKCTSNAQVSKIFNIIKTDRNCVSAIAVFSDGSHLWHGSIGYLQPEYYDSDESDMADGEETVLAEF